MCSTPLPAGMRPGDPSQPTDVAKDIAMEDWDLLFDAVIVRLRSAFDDQHSGSAAPRRLSWVQTRSSVMDCVRALDQLHLAATHEHARLYQLEAEGWPSAIRPAVNAAAPEEPPLQDEVLRAICEFFQRHQCTRAALPHAVGPSTRPSR